MHSLKKKNITVFDDEYFHLQKNFTKKKNRKNEKLNLSMHLQKK